MFLNEFCMFDQEVGIEKNKSDKSKRSELHIDLNCCDVIKQ